MFNNLFCKGIPPDVRPKPFLVQLEATCSCPVTSSLEEEIDLRLDTTSFQVVVESDKATPESPFLQAKYPQIS
ncbi:hypothetical protein BTVI_75813 [Pitangus sulphuratus]|nr:hypothetical protein BTVI_75813 [Pitangus sulphuratus]